eukprot:g9436.t3
MEDLQETRRIVCQGGAAHVVTLWVVARSTLRVEVETEDGSSRWCGEFAARYVEGITQKTGSAKKFPVFVKMLLDALGEKHGGSGTVFVDLLTYADLELLKARRVGHAKQKLQGPGGSGSGGGGGSSGNNKRYLILTYAGEYDRVHYPLPLGYVESPERGQLERTISRLAEDLSRRPLEVATSSARNNSTRIDGGGGRENAPGSSAQLLAENSELRRRVEELTTRLEESEVPSSSMLLRQSGGGDEGDEGHGKGLREVGAAGGGRQLTKLRRAYEELQTQLDDLREAHERLRLESASEIRRLRREAREGAKAVEEAAITAREAEDQVAGLREELEGSERDLNQARERQLALGKEVARLKKDLAEERESNRAMRAKLRENPAIRGRAATSTSTAPTLGPRAYGQLRQGRSFGSPSPGRGRTTGSRSAVGRSRSVGASRRLAESSSTNRSSSIHPSQGGRKPQARLGRAFPTSNATAGAGAAGFGRGRPRRADSPRPGSSGGGGGGGGGDVSRGPSSRGSSLASSRGRSRSAGSTRKSGPGAAAPAFDPTAYQREREARLRRLREDRTRRERREIGYSPARSSGRDSWMGSSRGRGGGSPAGVHRGRSAVRGSGRSSGYSSAASQASRASRGSSTRSRLSLSVRSDGSSASQPRRRRSRRVPSATRGLPSPAGMASPAAGGPPPRRPSASTLSARGTRGSRGGAGVGGVGGVSGSSRKYSTSGKFGTALGRRAAGEVASRLHRSGIGGGGRGGASGSVSPGRGRRREASSPSPANAGGRCAWESPRPSTLRPRNTSNSPTNYGRRAGGATGVDGINGGRGFLRLVRDSGNSSAATSASASASGRRQRRRDPWLVDDADGEQLRPHRHLHGRPGRRDSDRRGATLPVRVPGATVLSTGLPSQGNDSATEDSGCDSVGGIGGGGGQSAPKRQESWGGESDGGFMRRPGTAAGATKATPTPMATATRGSSSHRDRDREADFDRDPGRGIGGGGTGEWEGPPPSGSGGLASSRGSLGSSSLRSSGTRRRVELRTPAEEEAVRKSQELSTSLAASRKSSTNGDSHGSASNFRPVNTAEKRRADTTGDHPASAGDQACRRNHLSSLRGEGNPQQHRNSISPAAGMDAQAGREISDIDRRLGELHEFLKRAKEGGLGALPLPPPPPPVTTKSLSSQPASKLDASTAVMSPPAEAAESAAFELRAEESRSPPAADSGGRVGRPRSIDEDDADVLQRWQEGGGAGQGSAAKAGAWRVDEIQQQ